MSAEVAQNAQTLSQIVPLPTYEFLAHPPPPKQRPNQPSVLIPPPTPFHNRRRSSTTSVIAAWVARVQPGSPAPISPACSARRLSVHASPRRSSVTRTVRRASTALARRPSASFVSLLETPVAATPSLQDYKPDLAAYGYTCTIVPLSMTSQTTDCAPMPIPSLKARKVLGELIIPAVPAALPSPTQSPKKGTFKRLRSRLRAKSMPPPPRSPTSKRRRPSPAAVARRKKAAYAHAAAPLQSELALLQFADGGSEAAAVRRLVAPGDGVFRDAQGGVWWDEYEAWEYAHLLGGESAGAAMGVQDWVAFAEDEERRGSAGSLDSDLEARYAVCEEHAADNCAAFGDAVAPHLRKPAPFLDAFVPNAPNAPRTPASPVRHAPASRPKGKARRRPAPLTLSPPQGPPTMCATNSPDDARAAFLENSFAPEPTTDVVLPRTRNTDLRTIAKRPSRINLGGGVKGFLRAVGGRKD